MQSGVSFDPFASVGSSTDQILLCQIQTTHPLSAETHQWSDRFLEVQDAAVKAYNCRNPHDPVLSLMEKRAACKPQARHQT